MPEVHTLLVRGGCEVAVWMEWVVVVRQKRGTERFWTRASERPCQRRLWWVMEAVRGLAGRNDGEGTCSPSRWETLCCVSLPRANHMVPV